MLSFVLVESDHVGVGEPFGVPLRAWLPLGRDETASVLGQIGHALVAAHAAGIAHGSLTLERVFVTKEDGEVFARVFGFGVAIDDYRRVADDVAGFAALSSEIAAASPPNGFTLWVARCGTRRWSIAECVTELRTLFGTGGDRAGVAVGERANCRRLESAARRSDRRAVRARLFDHRAATLLIVGVVAAFAVGFARRAQSMQPASATASARRNPTPAALLAPMEAYEPHEDRDVLGADRASCADRYLNTPLTAARERRFRCVRGVLYQRVLDVGVHALKPEEREALRMACASLSDLGCVLRLER